MHDRQQHVTGLGGGGTARNHLENVPLTLEKVLGARALGDITQTHHVHGRAVDICASDPSVDRHQVAARTSRDAALRLVDRGVGDGRLRELPQGRGQVHMPLGCKKNKHRSSDECCLGIAEHALHGRIHHGDVKAVVEGDDAVGRGVHHARQSHGGLALGIQSPNPHRAVRCVCAQSTQREQRQQKCTLDVHLRIKWHLRIGIADAANHTPSEVAIEPGEGERPGAVGARKEPERVLPRERQRCWRRVGQLG